MPSEALLLVPFMKKVISYFLLLVSLLLWVSYAPSHGGDEGNKHGRPDSNGTVTDIAGNIFKTMKIGSQWWMAENLIITRYRNGDAISKVTDSTWSSVSSGANCANIIDLTRAATYGRLYNWYAVNDSRGIAPTGGM
jgi:hypothetical protein